MKGALRIAAPGFALIGVSYGLARYAYGLFLPSMRADVGLTATVAGVIGAGSYVGNCIALVAGMWLVGRLGARAVAIGAGAVAAVGMATIAASGSPWVLAAAMLFAGLSAGLASTAMGQAVSDSVATPEQPRANTVINSGTSIGVAICGPAALLATGHWRLAYLGFALLALATCLWLAWRLPGRGAGSAVAVPHRSNDPIPALGVAAATVALPTEVMRRSGLRSLAIPGALALLLAGATMGFSGAAYWTFSSDLIVQAGRQSRGVANAAWVLLGLAGLAGALAGDLVQRFGMNSVHRASLLAMAAATAGLALWPASAVAALASAAVFGAAYVLLTGVYLVWGVRLYADRAAVGLGLPFLTIGVGQIAGTAVAGAAIGHWGHSVAFIAFALVALAAMGFTCRVGAAIRSGSTPACGSAA